VRTKRRPSRSTCSARRGEIPGSYVCGRLPQPHDMPPTGSRYRAEAGRTPPTGCENAVGARLVRAAGTAGKRIPQLQWSRTRPSPRPSIVRRTCRANICGEDSAAVTARRASCGTQPNRNLWRRAIDFPGVQYPAISYLNAFIEFSRCSSASMTIVTGPRAHLYAGHHRSVNKKSGVTRFDRGTSPPPSPYTALRGSGNALAMWDVTASIAPRTTRAAARNNW